MPCLARELKLTKKSHECGETTKELKSLMLGSLDTTYPIHPL